MVPNFRTLLLIIALPFLAESQTAIWGVQAGPVYAPRWVNGFGMAAVIGAATKKVEVTGQIGLAGENRFRTFDEDGQDEGFAHVLVMLRYGRPGWMGVWPFIGTGIGMVENDDDKNRELLLPVLEVGVRKRFLYILQAGAALEIQEFERYQVAVRLNFAVGPFGRP